MSFERAISRAEIDEVKLTANEKIQEIFEEANNHAYPARFLRERFFSAILASSLLLDNFDPALYIERNHHNSDEAFLRRMILTAVKSVEMIKIFENETKWHLSPFSHHDISSWYEQRLKIAEKTFKTNGKSSVATYTA